MIVPLLTNGIRTPVIPHEMRDVLSTKKAPHVRGALFFLVIPGGFEPPLPA